MHVEASTRARITAVGELDGCVTDHLEQVVQGILREQDIRGIDVDLAGVTFIDSAGIRCLLTCRENASESGCQLRLRNLTPTVHRVLAITGLLGVFGVPEHLSPPSRSRA
ncbi:STAS domain-containing protein [Micromonospora vinacea]|uniref:STAS domain-containing protein n=1 Tax=Micromonospora vinacea TaxID=709878 RepID=UPI003D8B7028